MRVFAQVKDGVIWSLFSSPQLEENCPGVQEFESDAPLVAAFIEEHQIKGLAQDEP